MICAGMHVGRWCRDVCIHVIVLIPYYITPLPLYVKLLYNYLIHSTVYIHEIWTYKLALEKICFYERC